MSQPQTTNLAELYETLQAYRAKATTGKDNLIDFIQRTKADYKVAPHHRLIASYLEQVERGEIDRLMIFSPPRHGKSEIVSRRFPAWYLGRNPTKQIIAASYNSDLASDFGRDVRNLVADPDYHKIFGVSLRQDSKAADRWNTENGGAYIAAGVGSGITGRGAHVGVIDDPIKDRKEAESLTIRNNVWHWYTSTFYTRLMPGAAVILMLCMSGDTRVLMADGTEKPLADIKVGDTVATYDNGKLAVSTVRNWKNHGSDFIFTIKMSSGTIVKANERHPFLVCRNGGLEWIKLRDLVVGDSILKVSIGGGGEGSPVPLMDVKNPQIAKDTVSPITIKHGGQTGLDHLLSIQNHAGPHASAIDMELNPLITIPCSLRKVASAPFAGCLHQEQTYDLIGETSSVLTMTTLPARCEDCCATIVISRSDMERQRESLSEPLSTYEISPDCIIEITESGCEDVFDIQVDRTENFIANGLVSHNTRWHEDDLAGRLIKAMSTGGDQWVIVSLPAVAEIGDLLGRSEGEALWPEWYSVEGLKRIKEAIGSSEWAALYQQRPSIEGGNLFKREWWQYYRNPSVYEFVIQSWDTAFKIGEENDYSVCTTWGIVGNMIDMIDRFQARLEMPELKRAAATLALRHRPNAILIEDKASGQSLIQELKKDTELSIIPVKTDRDKVSRAHAVTPMIEGGRVRLPEWASWVDDYLAEMSAFPKGNHDDSVDSTTQALNYLRERVSDNIYGYEDEDEDRHPFPDGRSAVTGY